jgi:hypothetical protein
MKKFLHQILFIVILLAASQAFAQKKGKSNDASKASPSISPAPGSPGIEVLDDSQTMISDKAVKKYSNGIYLLMKRGGEEEGYAEGLKEIVRRFPSTQMLTYPELQSAIVMVNNSPEFTLFQEAFGGRYLIFSESDFDIINSAFPCAAEFKSKLVAFVTKNLPAK